MRVPLSWLREFVAVELEPEALAQRLTLLGMEVKGIERIGGEWREVVVGELLEVGPHPNSTKLSLTSVRTGVDAPPLSIVCGATNIAVGQRVPVALPGAVLPGGRGIGVTRIAGAESQGMLCSGDELRLTTDADGILILPPEAPLGRPLTELYGDVVLDIDVKPNRGDALSIVGLAREVAAISGARVGWPELHAPEEGDATSDHVRVDGRVPALCPRFVARYLDSVTVGPSPLDVQLRLTAAGLRPVSNVVDATNYVMLELGKPTHAFDAAAVNDGQLVVRLALAGERLETLDHVVRELDPETLLIADPTGPLAIAGVMGGAASEVGDATTAVIVESAIFDPVSIRRTAQRYALRSEASARFEKGQEHRLARMGADRVAQLIARWGGGRVARGVVDTDPLDPPLARVPFRPARVTRLLGTDVPTGEMRELLARVEVVTEPAAPGDAVPVVLDRAPVPLGASAPDALVAVVPAHRRDLAIEADIVEEVARIRGFETVPGRTPETSMPAYRPDPRRLVDTIRDLLSGQGLTEVVAHALVAPIDHERLGFPADDPATIRVTNPVAADHSELRRAAIPGLVRVLVDNERQRRRDVALFEIAPVHERRDGVPVQRDQLALLLAGDWQARSWDQAARAVEVSDAKGLLHWLVDRLHGGPISYAATDPIALVEHPGRTAAVIATSRAGHAVELGRVGELDPRYLAGYEVRAERVVFAVVEMERLRALLPERDRLVPVSRVPVVERDLAVVVDERTPAAEIDAVIRSAAGALLRDLWLFDRYQGAPLEPDEVSLAYRLRLQADRTLTDSEIDAVIAEITSELASRAGARIRT